MSEQAGAAGGNEWMLIGIDEKTARKQGVPLKIPVPKADFESMAEKGMQHDQLKRWITKFLSELSNPKWKSENADFVKGLETFISKTDSWARAQEAFQKNDVKKAIGVMKMIVNLDANDHAARLNLAQALASTGDHPAALKHFEAISATFADDGDYHVGYGHVHLAMGKKDEAIGEFVLSLEADPQNQQALDALKQLGVLVAIYENPKDASSLTYVRSDSVVAYLQQVWATEKRDLAYFLDQIQYHQVERRWEAVLAAIEAAEKIEGSIVETEKLSAAKVGALRALSRKEESVAAAKAFAAKHPASVAARVELGQALIASGQIEEARAEIDKALELDPGDLMALDVKFWPSERHDIEQVQARIPMIKEWIDAHPSAGGWRSFARAKLAVGSSEEAFEAFKKAVELAPKNDDLRAEWWGELARQGRFDEIIADATKLGDAIKKADWKLRWNEAEAYAGLGKKMEAQASYAAINFDESLHVDIRKRAKRAAQAVMEEKGPALPPASP